MHDMNPNKTDGEKAIWKINNNVASYFEQIFEATLDKTIAVRSLTSHL